ncbi:hypothetical protein BDN72DRAFT_855736 [Pluteus cervinus]|uniref:Uncharacterized protein n=1 Tax=Pluteus cervinus TaxID=181527 RepID=A0ACD3B2N3_9AGAR|nr:hypothetical protein BDN72DRAFT_855736 [Pluteus cervinus]
MWIGFEGILEFPGNMINDFCGSCQDTRPPQFAKLCPSLPNYDTLRAFRWPRISHQRREMHQARALCGRHSCTLDTEQRKRTTIALQPSPSCYCPFTNARLVLIRKVLGVNWLSSGILPIMAKVVSVYSGDVRQNAMTIIQYFERNGARKYLGEENP